MIRYLTLDELLQVHRSLLEQSGGRPGLRDLGALESAWFFVHAGKPLFPRAVHGPAPDAPLS